jgi:hypothetical protein
MELVIQMHERGLRLNEDPFDFFFGYVSTLSILNVNENGLARLFPTVLIGKARLWFK